MRGRAPLSARAYWNSGVLQTAVGFGTLEGSVRWWRRTWSAASSCKRLSRWSRGLASRYAHGIIYYCGDYAYNIMHFYYVIGTAFYGTIIDCYYKKKYFAASFGSTERRRRLRHAAPDGAGEADDRGLGP